MLPHKPRPNRRKVEVDLSAILIRSEESDRREKGEDVESPDAFPGWREWAISKPSPRIGSSDWANVVFAIGASLVGLSYTLFMFDDFDHVRLSSLRLENPVYARAELSVLGAKHFLKKTVSSHAAPAQSSHSILNSIPEIASTSALSTILPFREDLGSSLIPNMGRIGENTLSSSPGPTRSKGMMAPSGPSGSGNTPNPQGQNRSGPSIAQNGKRQLQTLAVSPRSKFASNRITLSSLLMSGTHHSQIGKSASQGLAGANNVASGRSAMRMESIGGSNSLIQNHPALNVMRMQNGLIAGPTLAGSLGGLNGAGLGGGSGPNRGGNPRR